MTELDTKFGQALVCGAHLMIQHGLNDWKVKLSSSRRVLADCNNSKKVIRFSKNFLTVATKEQLEGVAIHEIAHALVGSGHGHDRVFQNKVLEIGGSSSFSRANVEEPVMTHKYNLKCPDCGATSRSNRNRWYNCGKCWRDKGVKIKLIITENVLAVIPWPV